MTLICPVCQSDIMEEFCYKHDTHHTVIYKRNNKGYHHEYWQHYLGCGAFLYVIRHTRTHDIISVELVETLL